MFVRCRGRWQGFLQSFQLSGQARREQRSLEWKRSDGDIHVLLRSGTFCYYPPRARGPAVQIRTMARVQDTVETRRRGDGWVAFAGGWSFFLQAWTRSPGRRAPKLGHATGDDEGCSMNHLQLLRAQLVFGGTVQQLPPRVKHRWLRHQSAIQQSTALGFRSKRALVGSSWWMNSVQVKHCAATRPPAPQTWRERQHNPNPWRGEETRDREDRGRRLLA